MANPLKAIDQLLNGGPKKPPSSALGRVQQSGLQGTEAVQKYHEVRGQGLGLKDARYKPSVPMDVLYEIAINNMLAGPSTHMTNFVYNATNMVLSPMDTAARSLVSVFNSPQDKTYLREVVADVYGMVFGMYKAAQYMGRRSLSKAPGVSEAADETARRYNISTATTQSTRLDYYNRRISSQNLGLSEDAALGKLADGIGALVNLPASVLNTSDIAYKIVHDTKYKSRWAAHQVAEGKYKSYSEAFDAVCNDPEVSKRATRDAEYYTATGRPNMPTFSWVTDSDLVKLPGLRWIIPFKRTIANIAEQTLERSPLALASPTLAKRLAHKDPAERATAQARLLSGIGMLTAATMMFGDNLTGAAPRDSIGREAFDRIFGGEFLLKFDDGVIKLDSLGIVGQQLKAIAMYRQAFETMPPELFDPKNGEAMEQYLAGYMAPIAEVMFSNHYAENLAQFFEVFERAREQKSIKPIAQWGERLLVKTIPGVGSNLWEQWQKSENPIMRDTAHLGSMLMTTLPALREKVRPKYAFDGAPMLVNNLSDFESPTSSNRYKPDDILAQTYLRLGVEFTPRPEEIRAPSPGHLGDNRLEGVKVPITDAERDLQHKWIFEGRSIDPNNPEDRFARGMRPLPSYRRYMEDKINHPSFKTWPDAVQKEYLQFHRTHYYGQLNDNLRTIPTLRERMITAHQDQRRFYAAEAARKGQALSAPEEF